MYPIHEEVSRQLARGVVADVMVSAAFPEYPEASLVYPATYAQGGSDPQDSPVQDMRF